MSNNWRSFAEGVTLNIDALNTGLLPPPLTV
jgi:hypothetical protein